MNTSMMIGKLLYCLSFYINDEFAYFFVTTISKKMLCDNKNTIRNTCKIFLEIITNMLFPIVDVIAEYKYNQILQRF